jgi:Domain of unknown function (DUF4440)
MNTTLCLTAAALAAALALPATVRADLPGGLAPPALTATISALDAAAFDAFNHCDQPGQLETYGRYFAADLEFYHDNGGVTWTREAMVANTGKNVCGHYRRELVAGSMKVYPIKDFGAIEQGVHRFCQFATGKCEGLADFVIVWRRQGEQWEATRVLSYGHRGENAD